MTVSSFFGVVYPKNRPLGGDETVICIYISEKLAFRVFILFKLLS